MAPSWHPTFEILKIGGTLQGHQHVTQSLEFGKSEFESGAGGDGFLFPRDLFDVRLQQRLDVDPDDHVVADDGAAVFQFAVPTDLKILAIDAGLGDEADAGDGSGVAGIGPIRRFPLADVVHVQIDRPADAANRQHAAHLEVGRTRALAAGALESDGRVLGGVQEIRAA